MSVTIVPAATVENIAMEGIWKILQEYLELAMILIHKT